ncbi:MAG: 16S rRNA (cytosine(1402)-N(4))-methyltransferase RsmH [Acholeplasma sp.]|nr:16S rRNA (cytosine(1402)-N(4))-methyltransferase RsmH [Acholeplasma sp.]
MNEQKPKRRIRYKGKYPKHFEEKYKEKQPEKYQALIDHVMQKGNTPAGMHRSIMVDEILEHLNIQSGETGLDVTLGFGGHTKHMLTKLNHTGHIHGVDQDPIELPKTLNRLIEAGYTENDFTLHQLNFRSIDKIGESFDFILADLGLSSMQIDDPKRGFTYKFEGPLDLRMDPTSGISAKDRLRMMRKDEIEGMLVENSDEPYAVEIAKTIIETYQRGGLIETTKDLHQVVCEALKFLPKSLYEDAVKKASTRTFQALRIDVNNEFEALFDLLEKIPPLLNKGGRVAILSFHSGEDRLVKKAFKHFEKLGIYSSITGPILPSNDEVFDNPRARSAKLRCARKA